MSSKNDSLIRRHSKMLFDWKRTVPLLQAIATQTKPGHVVVDLGAGLGFLSLAACHAGAKRVYAIDVDIESLTFAEQQAKKAGMENRICFLPDHSRHIELIEKADLLIQETIGPLAFDENFLSTLLDAKKRFLKKSAKIIPEEVCLYGALATRDKKLLSKPYRLHSIESKNVKKDRIDLRKTFRADKAGKLGGILIWPKVLWCKGLETDASPFQQPTHWGQTLLQVPKHLLQKGDSTTFRLKIFPDPKEPKEKSQILWRVQKI